MTVQNPRIILTTGGTGGHVFPALAVAEEIKRTCPEAQILFMGGQYGKEAIWVNKAGLEFVGLSVRGMVGRGLKAVGAGFNMLCAVFQARKIIREFKPDVVAGFGGYAAFAGIHRAADFGRGFRARLLQPVQLYYYRRGFSGAGIHSSFVQYYARSEHVIAHAHTGALSGAAGAGQHGRGHGHGYLPAHDFEKH